MIDLTQEIRALSWKQPYGSAMLLGKVETRVWDTKYRGLVLICTSKAPYNEAAAKIISGEHQYNRILRDLNHASVSPVPAERHAFDMLDKDGYVIAIGELWHSEPMTIQMEDSCYVQYKPGLFAHHYRNVIPIEPFLWKGSQGWRTLTDEDKSKIKLL
jgi:hypothetical protein